jgi:TP901 family phage tail tape measure protein
MAFAETAPLKVRISLDDGLTGGVNKVLGSVGKLESGLGRAGKGVGQVAAGFARVGVVAAGAAATGLGVAVKWAGDFQAQLNTINTIALIKTPAALDALGQGIRDTAKRSGQSLDDLTTAYYDLLSAGIKVADAQGVLDQAVTLGIGALGTTTETVDLLTTAINAYGLDAAGAAKATDQFAQAVADGKVTVSEISASFANVASVAKSAGVGLNEIAAAYGFLTAQGVPAAEVTTEMNRAILDLIKPSKTLNDLQKKTGKNFAQIAADKGLVVALEEMRVAAEKAGIPFQNLFGRLEGYKFALQTTGPAFQAYIAEQAKVDKANGTAQEQANQRLQGFNFQLDVLKANVRDAGITIGSKLLPPLAELAKKATAFLARSDIQKKLQDLGDSLARAVEKIDFDKLLKTAEGFAKAFEPALSLVKLLVQFIADHPELGGLGIGALGANKLSGGLLGRGAGNILAGLLGSVGSRLPGVGGAFVQKVYVVNLPPGGFGGGGGAGIPGAGAGAGVAGGVGVGGAATLAAAIATPLIMNAVIPYLFKGAPGSGVQGGTFNKTPISQQNAAMFQGLMPSFTSLTQATRENTAALGAFDADRTALGTKVVQSQETTRLATSERLDAIKSGLGMVSAGTIGMRDAQRMLASKQDVANARLAAIQAKRTSFVVNNSITVKSTVSIASHQQAAAISARINRTTALAGQ